jgi:hypothetical protein
MGYDQDEKIRAATLLTTSNSNISGEDGDIVYKKNKKPVKENLKGVYLMSITFFVLFSSFGGGNSLMGSIFDQESLKNLGQIGAFALYIAFSLGVFFANFMVSN